MPELNKIPAEVVLRNPLITAEGFALLRRIQEHKDAPRWNHSAGDRLTAKHLEQVRLFEAELQSKPRQNSANPPDSIIERVSRLRDFVASFRMRIPADVNLIEFWEDIPASSREDIAIAPELQVPDDCDLSDLIIYRTAGTTGHSLLVPHSPVAASMYQPLLLAALGRYNIAPVFDLSVVACFSVCAQVHTVTYPTVLSAWNQAGFAKINLRCDQWRDSHSPNRFFKSLCPVFLTGDPLSFSEMMRLEIETAPRAMISTAVAMSPSLKVELSRIYKCPVIDWYSLTETGPIGYACPAGGGYHILPHDIFVECLNESGRRVPPGVSGEITVTGGRNPYLPLLRYRTGDWGRMAYEPCNCGDAAPRLVDLEGRKPVVFRSKNGDIINSVDISRVLRQYPIVQHEFVQHGDLSVELTVRPLARMHLEADALHEQLSDLFERLPVVIKIDHCLGERIGSSKTMPYQSELLED